MEQVYAIALGSNLRHARFGPPEAVLRAALRHLDGGCTQVRAAAPLMSSAPIGPSRRRYANSAAILTTRLLPDALLAHLKAVERDFGRRSGGQAWRARVLDLDILLWSGGPYVSAALCIPHREMTHRHFVLRPLCAIAPHWRHPLNGLTIRQLHTRLDQKRPAA